MTPSMRRRRRRPASKTKKNGSFCKILVAGLLVIALVFVGQDSDSFEDSPQLRGITSTTTYLSSDEFIPSIQDDHPVLPQHYQPQENNNDSEGSIDLEALAMEEFGDDDYFPTEVVSNEHNNNDSEGSIDLEALAMEEFGDDDDFPTEGISNEQNNNDSEGSIDLEALAREEFGDDDYFAKVPLDGSNKYDDDELLEIEGTVANATMHINNARDKAIAQNEWMLNATIRKAETPYMLALGKLFGDSNYTVASEDMPKIANYASKRLEYDARRSMQAKANDIATIKKQDIEEVMKREEEMGLGKEVIKGDIERLDAKAVEELKGEIDQAAKDVGKEIVEEVKQIEKMIIEGKLEVNLVKDKEGNIISIVELKEDEEKEEPKKNAKKIILEEDNIEKTATTNGTKSAVKEESKEN